MYFHLPNKIKQNKKHTTFEPFPWFTKVWPTCAAVFKLYSCVSYLWCDPFINTLASGTFFTLSISMETGFSR